MGLERLSTVAFAGVFCFAAACSIQPEPSAGKFTVKEIKTPQFEIKNFALSQDPPTTYSYAPGVSTYHDFQGKGTIATSEEGRSFMVSVYYKRKNLRTGLVTEDDTGVFTRVRNGLGEITIPCNEFKLNAKEEDYPPCEFEWTKIEYLEFQPGILKNATDPLKIRDTKSK